jgi:nitrogen regulatory protein P-II 2
MVPPGDVLCCMKLITAIIRPFKLDDVRKAIADIGIQGVTVTEVFGERPATKIELAVDDSISEQVIEAVCNVARTGRSGDGKLWVTELEQALRVRTGETGADAV